MIFNMIAANKQFRADEIQSLSDLKLTPKDLGYALEVLGAFESMAIYDSQTNPAYIELGFSFDSLAHLAEQAYEAKLKKRLTAARISNVENDAFEEIRKDAANNFNRISEIMSFGEPVEMDMGYGKVSTNVSMDTSEMTGKERYAQYLEYLSTTPEIGAKLADRAEYDVTLGYTLQHGFSDEVIDSLLFLRKLANKDNNPINLSLPVSMDNEASMENENATKLTRNKR